MRIGGAAGRSQAVPLAHPAPLDHEVAPVVLRLRARRDDAVFPPRAPEEERRPADPDGRRSGAARPSATRTRATGTTSKKRSTPASPWCSTRPWRPATLTRPAAAGWRCARFRRSPTTPSSAACAWTPRCRRCWRRDGQAQQPERHDRREQGADVDRIRPGPGRDGRRHAGGCLEVRAPQLQGGGCTLVGFTTTRRCGT